MSRGLGDVYKRQIAAAHGEPPRYLLVLHAGHTALWRAAAHGGGTRIRIARGHNIVSLLPHDNGTLRRGCNHPATAEIQLIRAAACEDRKRAHARFAGLRGARLRPARLSRVALKDLLRYKIPYFGADSLKTMQKDIYLPLLNRDTIKTK